jgi:hypothetical protein
MKELDKILHNRRVIDVSGLLEIVRRSYRHCLLNQPEKQRPVHRAGPDIHSSLNLMRYYRFGSPSLFCQHPQDHHFRVVQEQREQERYYMVTNENAAAAMTMITPVRPMQQQHFEMHRHQLQHPVVLQQYSHAEAKRTASSDVVIPVSATSPPPVISWGTFGCSPITSPQCMSSDEGDDDETTGTAHGGGGGRNGVDGWGSSSPPQ